MHSAGLRKFSEIQLYLVIIALPFEYYLNPTQSLITSLKFQVLFLAMTWACLKGVEYRQSRGDAWPRLKDTVPLRLQFAMLAFALIQIIAAISAPAYLGNALRAAAKTCIGILLAFIAADLARGSRGDGRPFADLRLNAVAAISLAGIVTALLGFGDWFGIAAFSQVVHVFQPSKFFLGDFVRFVSTMEYPNTAASFLAVALCATLTLALFRAGAHSRLEWRQALRLGMLAILSAALSLTYSRGALGAAILAIGIASWIFKRQISDRESRIALGLVILVLIAGGLPSYLVRRESAKRAVINQNRIAHYGWESNAPTKSLLPDKCYEENIAIQNDSSYSWRAGEFGVAYRWHNLADKQNAPLQVAADFRDDVMPKQKSLVKALVRTPRKEGEYLLIWFVYQRRDGLHELKDSYSPAIMCTIGAAGAAGTETLSPTARRYVAVISEERMQLSKALVPMRLELWSAAVRMFQDRPILGIGPDNFRYRKREFMDVPKGDETILANNLFLELLSGSGILGLLAFLWLVWEFGSVLLRRAATCGSRGEKIVVYFGIAYLAALLAHGFVDYFLKFTPTFLLFWLMLGILASSEAANNGDMECR